MITATESKLAYPSTQTVLVDGKPVVFNAYALKDENGNDILRGLGAAGVGAIYLGNVNTEFSLNSQTDNKTNAVVRQTGMYLKEDGTAGTMQQIDLAQ